MKNGERNGYWVSQGCDETQDFAKEIARGLNSLARRIFVLIEVIVLLILLLASSGWAKDIDLSVTGFVGADQGVWKSGDATSPTGTMREWALTYGASVQAKYTAWRYQPTAEFSYRHAEFDFSNWQARVQEAKPDTLSFRVGVTRDFRTVSLYGLIGVTWVSNNTELIETTPALNHGKHDANDATFSLKLGVYKLWKVGGLRVGPEASVEIFPDPPGFSRCREFRTSYVVPQIGLRAQW